MESARTMPVPEQAIARALDPRDLSVVPRLFLLTYCQGGGVHVCTCYRWCWWLRNAALSYEMERHLAGIVEADELYHIAGNKGQATQGGPKPLGRQPGCRRKKCEPGRGHYDKDRPASIEEASRSVSTHGLSWTRTVVNCARQRRGVYGSGPPSSQRQSARRTTAPPRPHHPCGHLSSQEPY